MSPSSPGRVAMPLANAASSGSGASAPANSCCSATPPPPCSTTRSPRPSSTTARTRAGQGRYRGQGGGRAGPSWSESWGWQGLVPAYRRGRRGLERLGWATGCRSGGGDARDVAGATGLVGGLTLRRLLDDPRCGAVVAPTRRPLALTHGKLENPVLAFDALPTSPEWARVDAIICALGSTMAQAGSREAFHRIDHDYPLAFARLAKAQGRRPMC